VVEACNGQEGLTRLDGDKIHLIISDVNMPILDGIGFLKEVKRHPTYRFTPVIMLTTEAGEDKKASGRAAGAKAWIIKPFQPAVMLDAVAKLVMA
jgi:two-component system, chemotaxis family, chemotaxis protein CheY